MQNKASTMDFRNFFKSIGDQVRAKKYVGIIHGNLPIGSTKWGSSDFLNALDASLYVNRAIAKRADKVGEIEFLLQDAKGKKIENDPLLSLLYKPNKVFTGRQFWSLYQKYYDAVGEAYILIESSREIFDAKKVSAMHLLNPTMVEPKFDADGAPTGYTYKTNSGEITYRPEQIIYIHNPDPKHPLRGQSLLKAGVTAIQTETQIGAYHSRILENGGKVEGVFTFKTPSLTEQQLENLKSQYQKEYGAAKKAGLPLFLGGDAQYIKTGMSPDELSFLDAKKMTLEDICILTGVPKSMLASTSEVKFDNADADRSIFLRETIKPLLVTLTTALDEFLFPDGKNLTFVDPTPENIDQKLKETESGIKNYYMTINEARERHGLDPIDGADDIMVPFSVMPLGDGPEDLNDKQKSILKSLRLKDETPSHPLKDYDMRRMYWGVQIKRMDAREKGFKSALDKYFEDQRDRMVEQLQPANTRTFRKKGLIDDLFHIDVEVKIGKTVFIPLMVDLLKQAGIDAMEFAGSEGAFNMGSDIQNWIGDRADIFLRSINETTLDKLKGEFAASIAAEEGREALINRIQDTYGGIKKARGALIARTEVHNATQFGTMQGYKQAGLNTKIWVAVVDGSTRESHAGVDGEERPIDRPFSNGLMFPGDPRGSAEEVINCRCVI